MKIPLTDHEYNINENGWVSCNNTNTTDNGNGTYTIIDDALNADIPANGLQVRVKALGGNPPSASLYNTVSFHVPDSEALAYIQAANINVGDTYTEKNILGETIIDSVFQLFSSLKDSGIYNKLKALYLYNGNNDNYNSINAISPGVNDLILAGSPSPDFTSQGMILALGAYAKTGIVQSDFPSNSISFGTYFTKNIQNSSVSAFDWGVFDGSSSGIGFAAQAYLPQGTYMTEGGLDNQYLKPFRGLKTMNITGSGVFNLHFDGVKRYTGTSGSTVIGSDFWIGGLNYTGGDASNTFKSAGWHGIDFMSEGLTDAENTALYPIIETYCKAIERGTRRIVFNGDSITVGYWSTPTTFSPGYFYQGWAHQVGNNYNLQPDVRAVNGWTLGNMISDGLANHIPDKANDILKLFFAFGTNETFGAVPIVDYKNNYRTVLNYALAHGWEVDDICINLGYYDTVFDQTLKDTYIQAALDICNEFGIVNYLNGKTVMVGGGGSTTLENSPPFGTAGLHPNQNGHDLIANAWIGILGSI